MKQKLEFKELFIYAYLKKHIVLLAKEIILLITISIFLSISMFGKDYQITGKVKMNAKDYPSNFFIYYKLERNLDCDTCLDELNLFTNPNETGNFSFSIKNAEKGDKVRLLVVYGKLVEYFSPFLPPFHSQKALSGKYKGAKISLGTQTSIKVGKLNTTIRYRPINITLREISADRFPTNNEIWVKLKDKNGNIITMSSLPQRALSPKTNSLIFLLPKDIWNLEFSFTESPWKSIGNLRVNLNLWQSHFVLPQQNKNSVTIYHN